MADSSDVQAALVGLVASVLYPAGVSGVGAWSEIGSWGKPATAQAVGMAYGGGEAALSAAGLPVRIYRGWPVAQQLAPDLAAGVAHMTVFQPNAMGRLAGGNLDPERSYKGALPTVFVSVLGNVVTLTGTATPGNLVGLLIDNVSYVYRVQPGDTLVSIANGLEKLIGVSGLTDESGAPLLFDDGTPFILGDPAAIVAVIPDLQPMLNGTIIDTENGPLVDEAGRPFVVRDVSQPIAGVTLTIGTTNPIIARTGSQNFTVRRPRQQTEQHTVSCWAPTPDARDAICKLVDTTLSDTRWLKLPDQQGRLVWAGTRTDDTTTKAALWRRDLFYHVTYWTTLTRLDPAALFGITNELNVNGGVITTTIS